MIKFGIEIETCCTIDDEKKYDSIYDFAPEYVEILSELAKKKKTEFEFLNVVNEDKIYNEITWMIDEDITVNCDNGIPVEIITPIMTQPEDFENIFQNIILDKKFTYISNDTQGIHINISHPKQDTLNFLKFWWYFEPLFLRFLSLKRQLKIEKYAKPLRKIFENFYDIEKSYEKYYKIADSKYSAVSVKKDRFEIRIIDGSMDCEFIMNWLKLCIGLLNISISKKFKEDKMTDDIKTMFENLFLYIKDKELKEYFEMLYEKNNGI
jgi:hypothetical protein